MAANDIDKRPNYFDGQFLQDIDFRAEQDYYLDRQRRQARLLLISGIAEGLTVAPVAIGTSVSTLKITVSEGTAIDAAGRQLVLTTNTAIASKTADGTWFLVIRYDQKLTDPQADGAETSTRWQETPLLEFSNTESNAGISLAKVVIQNNAISAFDLSVRQYSGIYFPSSKLGEGASLRSGGDTTEDQLAILTGNLKITGKLEVSETFNGKQAKFSAIGIGLSDTTDLAKKLQIEQGELRIRASHNQDTADIAALYKADQTQGIGIGASRIEAIGTVPDQSIELRPKGSGQVIATQTLSVQKFAIAESIDEAHLDINASGGNAGDYAKFRFRADKLNGWLGYHRVEDPNLGTFNEFVLWDFLQKQAAKLKVGDLLATRTIVAESIRSNGAITSPMWNVTQLFNNQKGALDLRTSFASQGGTLLVIAAGSGFSAAAGQTIGMNITIDNKSCGTAQTDAPNANTRYSFVGNTVVVRGLPPQKDHVLTLSAISTNTKTNDKDFFNVTLIEFPF